MSNRNASTGTSVRHDLAADSPQLQHIEGRSIVSTIKYMARITGVREGGSFSAPAVTIFGEEVDDLGNHTDLGVIAVREYRTNDQGPSMSEAMIEDMGFRKTADWDFDSKACEHADGPQPMAEWVEVRSMSAPVMWTRAWECGKSRILEDVDPSVAWTFLRSPRAGSERRSSGSGRLHNKGTASPATKM